MVVGRHRRELSELRAEKETQKLKISELVAKNEKLENLLKEIKDRNPQVETLVTVLRDLNTIGGGMIEIRRLHPEEILIYPTGGR